MVVVAGKGNNGNDGREAARRLRRRGARVEVVEAGSVERLPGCDLVVDGAYGTGFRGTYAWPTARRADGRPGRVPVLAIDIPSGVDGVTGSVGPEVGRADATVTFAALKPGLLFEPGAGLAGDVVVADIGLDVSAARTHLVEDTDVAAWWPIRSATSHKWQAAVWVVAGAPGMGGAAALASGGAQRPARATCGSPARAASAVSMPRSRSCSTSWPAPIGPRRCSTAWTASVLWSSATAWAPTTPLGAQIRGVLAAPDRERVPTVVDADGLTALGLEADGLVGPRTILTPHDGEFARLDGAPPGADRLGADASVGRAAGLCGAAQGRPDRGGRPRWRRPGGGHRRFPTGHRRHR